MPKPIPAPHCKFLTRPPEQDPICATTMQTTSNFNQILAQLTSINQPQTTIITEAVPGDQVQDSSPSSLATNTSTTSMTEDTLSDVTTSDKTPSTSSDSSTTSTTSDRQLRPRYPINCNEKLNKVTWNTANKNF